MTPSVGAKLGKSAKAAPKRNSSSPPASAIRAEISVSRHGRERAEDQGQDDHGHRHADQLAHRGGLLLGLVDDLTVPGDLDAGPLADRGHCLEPLARSAAQLRGALVVLHRHEGDAAVLRQLPLPCAANGLGAEVTLG